MAMPRPEGKALRIAEKTIPGMRKEKAQKSSRSNPREYVDVETLKMEVNTNQGRLPKKYR